MNVTVLDANDPPVFSLNIYMLRSVKGCPRDSRDLTVVPLTQTLFPAGVGFLTSLDQGMKSVFSSINPLHRTDHCYCRVRSRNPTHL